MRAGFRIRDSGVRRQWAVGRRRLGTARIRTSALCRESETLALTPLAVCATTSVSLWRRRRFGVRQLAAALFRPACRPHSGVGWLMGASKLARAKRQQAAALQSCASNSRLCHAEELSHRLPKGKGWTASTLSPVGAGRARGHFSPCAKGDRYGPILPQRSHDALSMDANRERRGLACTDSHGNDVVGRGIDCHEKAGTVRKSDDGRVPRIAPG